MSAARGKRLLKLSYKWQSMLDSRQHLTACQQQKKFLMKEIEQEKVETTLLTWHLLKERYVLMLAVYGIRF
jgi:hypothetical protein